MKKRKLSIEYVRKSFEKDGYVLLSEEYDYHTRLYYVCPKGHKHSTLWGNWQKGHRCPYCDGQNKPIITDIKNEFEQEGFILLTELYINNRAKLKYICPKGHRHSISYGAWQQGQRCPHCRTDDEDTIKKSFIDAGYILIENQNINSANKLKYICPNGHEHSVTWGNWKQGRKCPYCSGVVKKTINDVKSIMKDEGYSLLSTEYINAHSKLYVECPKGHRYYVIWNNWRNGKRCPSCTSAVSKWEAEVKDYIKDLDISFLSNDQSILMNRATGKNLELDIWFPQLNKAIECNGDYWHSIEKVIERDKIKLTLCKEKNIDLLILNDMEWEKNKSACRSKIEKFIMIKGGVVK